MEHEQERQRETERNLRDEGELEGSPWRYNDITTRSLEDERDVR